MLENYQIHGGQCHGKSSARPTQPANPTKKSSNGVLSPRLTFVNEIPSFRRKVGKTLADDGPDWVTSSANSVAFCP
jgi:hypothetical protein